MTCYDGTTCRFEDEIDQLRSCLVMAARHADNAESALAAMTARAEQAEAKLAVLLGADKPNKSATPTQIMRHWMLVASQEKRRADAAEHQLAAVPWGSLAYCWHHEGDLEDDVWVNHSDTVDNWLHVYMPRKQDAQP
jgi:hypothetical protein